MVSNTQACSRCIYDETIPYITFDEQGVCNYCHEYDKMDKAHPTGSEGWKALYKLAHKAKKSGRGKPYDVVVGVSGGCDSSYTLWLTKELGLRPIAVHFDNGWNEPIGTVNLKKLVAKLDVPLMFVKSDQAEFDDLFKAFFKASVPDIDTSSDIALAVAHYMVAEKFDIKYIFDGHSFRTEGISPPGWFYMDAKYIRSVHKQYGLEDWSGDFPNLWMHKMLKWMVVKRIKKIRPLYYLNYNKEQTKEFLAREYGWEWYGGHHMENRTAYFVNNYYLPKKFGYDLRYCEYSALVRSGQMSREEALEKIQEPKPFDEKIIEEIKERFYFTDEVFDYYMQKKKYSYRDFKTYKQTFERWRWLFWIMSKMKVIPMSFYLKYTKKYKE